MSNSYVCNICGEEHSGLALSFGPDAPDAWLKVPDVDHNTEDTELGTDQCVIHGDRFFIRGRIEYRVDGGSSDEFAWLVWAEVSSESFFSMTELWDKEGREQLAPLYDGRLANELAFYDQATIGLSLKIHTREVGQRPFFELVTPHTIRNEQANGITTARLREINNLLLHR